MKNTLIHLQYLRIIACLAVVMLHASSETLFLYTPVIDYRWWIGNIVACTTHWAVPVFFMISGALHLRKVPEKGWFDFYSKKISRVGIPLLFSIVFFAFYYHYTVGQTLSISFTVHRLIFDHPYEHLYFLIVLLALFGITPLLLQMRIHKPYWYLTLFVLAMFITFFKKPTRFMPIEWLPFLSYYMLGFELEKRKVNISNYSLFVFACLSISIQLLGTALLTTHSSEHRDGLYFFSYQSPYTLGLAIVVYLYVQKNWERFKANISLKDSTIFKMSNATYWIYIFHPVGIYFVKILLEKVV